MKKMFVLFLLSFAIVSCDWGTEPKTPDPIIIHDTIIVQDTTKKDTVKKDTTHKKVTLNDTTISFSARMNIVGKIQEKTSSGVVKGGFSAVACLEKTKKCVKTNSKGQYAFTTPSVLPKFAARKMSDDTLVTPETIITSLYTDTGFVIDTIFRNDTTFIYYNMYVDTNYAFNDSVNIYADSRLIFEIPVTSWKSILPDVYVVQRNISGKIIQNDYMIDLKSIEGVYWNLDSIALVIPLELSDNKLTYSGFIYQPYNDSSFITGNRVNNIFVRALDNNDSVFGLSNIITYSERSGDLNSFDSIVPGAIIRYPKPNCFRVIKEGDNISRIITSYTDQFFYNPNGYDLDSLFIKPQFTKEIKIDSIGNNIIENYNVNAITAKIFNLNNVDTIGFYFESDSTFSATFKLFPDEFEYSVNTRVVNVVPGKNLFKFYLMNWPENFRPDGIKHKTPLSMEIGTIAVKNLKTIVWFK